MRTAIVSAFAIGGVIASLILAQFKIELERTDWTPLPIRYPDTVEWRQYDDDDNDNHAILQGLGPIGG